jgi:ubiquinone/menaquinone biosynthesis C-methylase UbiE
MKIIRPSYSSYGPVEQKGMLLYYYSSNRVVRYYFWSRLSSLFDLAEFHPKDTVLEIGFGPGVIFPSLANVCSSVIGVDPMLEWISDSPSSSFKIAKNMLKSERIEDKVELVRGDGQNIPLEQETCDVVVATDVLEHMPDLSRTMKEIDRILKKEGLLLACVPMENIFRRNARKILELPGLSSDEHFYKEILVKIESVFQITKMKLYPIMMPISLLVSARKKK